MKTPYVLFIKCQSLCNCPVSYLFNWFRFHGFDMYIKCTDIAPLFWKNKQTNYLQKLIEFFRIEFYRIYRIYRIRRKLLLVVLKFWKRKLLIIVFYKFYRFCRFIEFNSEKLKYWPKILISIRKTLSAFRMNNLPSRLHWFCLSQQNLRSRWWLLS